MDDEMLEAGDGYLPFEGSDECRRAVEDRMRLDYAEKMYAIREALGEWDDADYAAETTLFVQALLRRGYMIRRIPEFRSR